MPGSRIRSKLQFRRSIAILLLILTWGTLVPSRFLFQARPALASTALALFQATPTIQFLTDSYTVAENSPSVTVTLTRIGPTNVSTSVGIGTSNGTAVAGQDYSTVQQLVTFSSGQTTKTVNIPVLDDTSVEGNESFTVGLIARAGSTLGSPSTATITITDNDSASSGQVQFGLASYTVDEGVGNASVTVTRTGSSSGSGSVSYATSNGTALAGTDYTATSGTLTFAGGETSKTVSVPIINDTTSEPSETINLTLSNPTGSVTPGSPGTTTITITDNDTANPGQLQFSPAAYTVGELGISVTLTVSRINGSNGSVGVNYATANGTAIAGIDYTGITNGTLTFASGETSKTIVVSILDDTSVETSETFTVTLTNPTGGATLGSAASANVIITDNDTTTSSQLEFSKATYAVRETETASPTRAFLTISRVGSTSGNTTVTYQTANGTATAGSDYTVTAGTITFYPGESAKVVTIPVLDDSLPEQDETFLVTLSNPVGATLGTTSTATVTIRDSSTPASVGQLGLTAPTYMASETVGFIKIGIIRTDGGYGPLTFSYATSNGSAIAGSDFTATTGQFTFPHAIVDPIFINLPIVSDTLTEGDETLTFTLTGTTGLPMTATITIKDDGGQPQPGYFKFASLSSQVIEANSAANLTISRVGGSLGAVDVTYETIAGSAQAGTDYTGIANGIVHFGDSETSKTISIPILGDTVFEPTESFNVRLVGASGEAAILVADPATVTIIDDDSIGGGTLKFSKSNYRVREGEANAVLTVVRIGNTNTSASVSFSTAPGTAVAGQPGVYNPNADYTTTSGTLNFGPGETTKDFQIIIPLNEEAEPDETFTVSLSNPVGAALDSTPTTTVTIRDYNSAPLTGTVQYSANNFGASEAVGRVIVAITRIDGTSGNTTITYGTASGTALANTDFTPKSGQYTFYNGQSAPFYLTIDITPDTLTEGNETFSLLINNQVQATVTIADDGGTPQPGLLKLESIAYQTIETQPTVALTVLRTGGSSGQVGCSYSVTGQTATAGADFTGTGGTLTFLNGETSQTIIVPLVNDLLPEGDERFTVTLNNPTGGASLDTPITSTITIVDNDLAGSQIQFSLDEYSFREGEANAQLTVIRTGSVEQSATVNYTTVAGTAIPGQPGVNNPEADYSELSGTLSFAPGETTKSIGIILLLNEQFEPNETFGVTLSNCVGATLGTPASTTVTVRDYSSPATTGQIQFSSGNFTANEGDGGVQVFITRINGANGTRQVNYSTSNGTAAAGSDYTPASGTFTFPSGYNFPQPFLIPITKDTLVEGNETINVKLTDPATGTLLATSVVTIADGITSPHPGYLQLTSINYTVDENGGTAVVTVARTGGSIGTVGVSYLTNNGTAIAGTDYQAQNGVLTFGDGELLKIIEIPIIDDTVYQDDVSFSIHLLNPTGGGALGPITQAEVTIVDNEPSPPGQFQFERASYSVNENEQFAILTIKRVNGRGGQVAVEYFTTNGTAQAGNDYSLVTSGLEIFEDRETTRTIRISMLNDLSAESPENFTVTLRNPTGGATLGSPTSTVVTIYDDDAVPEVVDIFPSRGRVGYNIPATFTGTSFGANPTIEVSGTGVQVSVESATNGEINATFHIDPTAAPGDRTVTVRNGNNISNTLLFTVNNASDPVGQTIIDPTPNRGAGASQAPSDPTRQLSGPIVIKQGQTGYVHGHFLCFREFVGGEFDLCDDRIRVSARLEPEAVGTRISIVPNPVRTFDAFSVAVQTSRTTAPGPYLLTITGESFEDFGVYLSATVPVTVLADGEVEQVQLQAINSPLDQNPNAGGGRRIFPDKPGPGNNTDMKRVRVRARTTFFEGTTIYFKSFDVDDPSSDTALIDSNGRNGNDNRVEASKKRGAFATVGGEPEGDTITAQTDSNGFAEVDFFVTLQPGDNFKIAASGEAGVVDEITVDGTDLKYQGQLLEGGVKARSSDLLTVWRYVHVELDRMAPVQDNRVPGIIQATNFVSSEQETIVTVVPDLNLVTPENFVRFKKGALEVVNNNRYIIVDAYTSTGTGGQVEYKVVVKGLGIESIPVGPSCYLYDDDDYNTNQIPSERHGDIGEAIEPLPASLSLLQYSDNPNQNVLAPAYIKPVFDGGGNLANNTIVPFVLNFDLPTGILDLYLNNIRNCDANRADDFWVAHILLAYQGKESTDGDHSGTEAFGLAKDHYASPQDMPLTNYAYGSSAEVFTGAISSIVFAESNTDYDVSTSFGDAVARGFPISIGIQFGLCPLGGVMSLIPNHSFPRTLTETHVNNLRWRASSPGKPYQP